MLPKNLVRSMWVGFAVCAVSLVVYAWVPLVVANDPLVRMPGTQPAQGVTIEAPNRCMNCHEGYDPLIEPGHTWKGGMMAQAARDPIFWACTTVAAQDSVWVLGNPNAADLCLRCHFPQGWMAGRSDPPNASRMTGSDYDGIHCDFCHSMYDPFFEATYAGTREGSDWVGYWDEATPLSASEALKTSNADRTQAAGIKLFSGADFYSKTFLPQYATYTENASGQYFVSATGDKRASFADAEATHKMFYSRYHKSKYFCATCHDVSNPALANLGLSGLPDQSGGTDLISEQYSAHRFFHVERTFSEFMLSAYAQQGGAATNPEFVSLTGIDTVAKCQDCHMFDAVGRGCDKSKAPIRPIQSTAHPNSGMPVHDLTGGNTWITHILGSLDPSGPIYDPVNAQIMNKTTAQMTLDLNAGISPINNGAALAAAVERAKDQLRFAATIKDLHYDPATGELTFKVQNNTGHKLISGFPEGRRMFLSITAWVNGRPAWRVNPYDYAVGTLKGLSPETAPASPPLGAGEVYVDELVYEAAMKSDLTGEDKTFHFVLATGRYKDNRIPPKGFDLAASYERIAQPVWHGVDAPDYFSADEYADGYHQVALNAPANAEYITVELYYQGTSREYVEFLRDQINGTGNTLSSPTPSGEANAYIIQTDPFFQQLRVWGDILWDLWVHNHGLNGSGKAVAGIVPFRMTSAAWGTAPQLPRADLSGDGAVDMVDFAAFADDWLRTGCVDPTWCDGADFTRSGTVELSDLLILADEWLRGK